MTEKLMTEKWTSHLSVISFLSEQGMTAMPIKWQKVTVVKNLSLHRKVTDVGARFGFDPHQEEVFAQKEFSCVGP